MQALCDRIAERRLAAVEDAEEAEWLRDVAWDRASRAMPPVAPSGLPAIDDFDLFLFAAATSR